MSLLFLSGYFTLFDHEYGWHELDQVTVSWDAAWVIIIMVCFLHDEYSVEKKGFFLFLSCLGDRLWGCKLSYQCGFDNKCVLHSWKEEHLSIDCCFVFVFSSKENESERLLRQKESFRQEEMEI